MFRPREDADKSTKHQLEAPLRVLWLEAQEPAGCSPMMSFNSGTRSTMSRPFGPSASRMASRQRDNSASLLLRSGRTRL